jgi:hypothetical protein
METAFLVLFTVPPFPNFCVSMLFYQTETETETETENEIESGPLYPTAPFVFHIIFSFCFNSTAPQ